jgi:hypothetical protein
MAAIAAADLSRRRNSMLAASGESVNIIKTDLDMKNRRKSGVGVK